MEVLAQRDGGYLPKNQFHTFTQNAQGQVVGEGEPGGWYQNGGSWFLWEYLAEYAAARQGDPDAYRLIARSVADELALTSLSKEFKGTTFDPDLTQNIDQAFPFPLGSAGIDREGYGWNTAFVNLQQSLGLTSGLYTTSSSDCGTLAPYYNNTGISDDGNTPEANVDEVGYSYSTQALQTAGIRPGAALIYHGVAFQWPNVPSGTADNVVAQGQTISLTTPASGTTLFFLGAATNGPVTGTGTITYSDGTTQTLELGFSDWTLNANTVAPSYGNGIVANLTYRNNGNLPDTSANPSQGRDPRHAYVFSASVPLQDGRTVGSVTLPPLPATVNGRQPEEHIFALAVSDTALGSTPTGTPTNAPRTASTDTATATPVHCRPIRYARGADPCRAWPRGM
jgi:hypothetical protein